MMRDFKTLSFACTVFDYDDDDDDVRLGNLGILWTDLKENKSTFMDLELSQFCQYLHKFWTMI